MTRLHVNIDHVATVRQARGTSYPDPVPAAPICEMAGAAGITIHLREDRRHIIDRDVELIRQVVTTVLNLEMAATEEMLQIACRVRPDMCTLVPEKREERTTEGGMAVSAHQAEIAAAVKTLVDAGICVSLFIDPDLREVEAAKAVGAQMVELHTGDYAEAPASQVAAELARLTTAAQHAAKIGLRVAAGHGLHYHNVAPVSRIPEVEELNIGHAIIARAIFVGLDAAVRQMLEAMDRP
ncbi:MAG: pyridoxine 5'-phosphate synthase [Myxococcales bacterium]|jgi:pyridoxine 5-phosphate synthase|nr:pyridoxine 5'-phosphate synthase [Myxococcales bacterium]